MEQPLLRTWREQDSDAQIDTEAEVLRDLDGWTAQITNVQNVNAYVDAFTRSLNRLRKGGQP